MTIHGDYRPSVVVVGASRGIGRAIASVAAREGNVVVLVARSREGLAAAAIDVRKVGGEPFTLELDLLAADATTHLKDFLIANNLFCSVLVNNAGYGLRGAATLLPVADQLGIIDLNIRVLTEMTLRFLPEMVARRSGGVINLGSIAGSVPGPYMTLYYASKAFVHSFSDALHQEVRDFGVTVTCVAPGPVSTEFLERSGADRATLFKILPRLDADYIAARAWLGFKSRRRRVVPGLLAKLITLSATVLPTAVILPVIARLQRRSKDSRPCSSGKSIKDCRNNRPSKRNKSRQ